MRGTGYAWRALEKQLPMELKEKIVRMRFTKDRMGCVFDIPSDCDSEISEKWTDGRFDSLQKATELPELLESDSSFSSPSQNGFSRGGGGGRGGRGGFRRSFGSDSSPRGGGRGRGGFNSRGRGGGQFNGGFKRKNDFDISSQVPQNKKIKFD